MKRTRFVFCAGFFLGFTVAVLGLPLVKRIQSRSASDSKKESDPLKSAESDAVAWVNSTLQFEDVGDPFSAFTSDSSLLGPSGKPNTQVHVVRKKGKELVFSTDYSFDQLGRRITPNVPGQAKHKSRLALFSGDTIAFGAGVADNETAEYYFSKINPAFRSYNYAFLGHGPQQMLARLSDTPIDVDVSEKSGVGIYMLRDNTVTLAAGKESWATGFPRYVIDGAGKLVRAGKYDASTVSHVNWTLPSTVSKQDYELAARILIASKEAFEKRFHSQEFYVVFLPITTVGPYLKPLLLRAGVRVIDLSDMDIAFRAEGAFMLDTNLKPIANYVLAEEISRKIQNFSQAADAPAEKTDFKSTFFERCFAIPTHINDAVPLDDVTNIILETTKDADVPLTATGEMSMKELQSSCSEIARKKRLYVSTMSSRSLVPAAASAKCLHHEPLDQAALAKELGVDSSVPKASVSYLYDEYYLYLFRRCRN